MPPVPSRYRFVFTDVFGPGALSLQLQEVELLSPDGALLPVSAASNPGGSSPAGETPEKVVDGIVDPPPSQWQDVNFGANRKSILEIVLQQPAQVGRYVLWTSTNRARDPTSWHLDFYSDEEGDWFRLDTSEAVVPPDTSLTAYFEVGSGFGFNVASDAYSAGDRVSLPPPPSPSSPPATIHRTDEYRLLILGTRAEIPMVVQLQEVRFYGDASQLAVLAASNPGGCQPNGAAGIIQTADNLIDANIDAKESKWLDLHMAQPDSCPDICSDCRGTSELYFTLRSAATLRSYDFVTANDNTHRDPPSAINFAAILAATSAFSAVTTSGASVSSSAAPSSAVAPSSGASTCSNDATSSSSASTCSGVARSFHAAISPGGTPSSGTASSLASHIAGVVTVTAANLVFSDIATSLTISSLFVATCTAQTVSSHGTVTVCTVAVKSFSSRATVPNDTS